MPLGSSQGVTDAQPIQHAGRACLLAARLPLLPCHFAWLRPPTRSSSLQCLLTTWPSPSRCSGRCIGASSRAARQSCLSPTAASPPRVSGGGGGRRAHARGRARAAHKGHAHKGHGTRGCAAAASGGFPLLCLCVEAATAPRVDHGRPALCRPLLRRPHPPAELWPVPAANHPCPALRCSHCHVDEHRRPGPHLDCWYEWGGARFTARLLAFLALRQSLPCHAARLACTRACCACPLSPPACAACQHLPPPRRPSSPGSYFHYSVPGGFTAPQAKDISPRPSLLGRKGDPMCVAGRGVAGRAGSRALAFRGGVESALSAEKTARCLQSGGTWIKCCCPPPLCAGTWCLLARRPDRACTALQQQRGAGVATVGGAASGGRRRPARLAVAVPRRTAPAARPAQLSGADPGSVPMPHLPQGGGHASATASPQQRMQAATNRTWHFCEAVGWLWWRVAQARTPKGWQLLQAPRSAACKPNSCRLAERAAVLRRRRYISTGSAA